MPKLEYARRMPISEIDAEKHAGIKVRVIGRVLGMHTESSTFLLGDDNASVLVDLGIPLYDDDCPRPDLKDQLVIIGDLEENTGRIHIPAVETQHESPPLDTRIVLRAIMLQHEERKIDKKLWRESCDTNQR